MNDPCDKSPCSHLCLLVPGGRRCACPDGATQAPLPRRSTQDIVCDAGIYQLFYKTICFLFSAIILSICNFIASERPRPSPRICPCENGGICLESVEESSALIDGLTCSCPSGISGARCEYGGAQGSGIDQGGSKIAAIVVPIIIVILVVSALAVYLYKKRPL